MRSSVTTKADFFLFRTKPGLSNHLETILVTARFTHQWQSNGQFWPCEGNERVKTASPPKAIVKLEMKPGGLSQFLASYATWICQQPDLIVTIPDSDSFWKSDFQDFLLNSPRFKIYERIQMDEWNPLWWP